jgi:hypothetical protein
MELEEEDESVSSSPDPATFKGGSTVCPPTERNIIPENPENVRPATASDVSVKPHGSSSEEDNRPNVIPFDLYNDQEDTNLSDDDDATSGLDATAAELIRWHLQLGHLPFANIRLMAARKEIPSRLAKCRIPKCQSCLYG